MSHRSHDPETTHGILAPDAGLSRFSLDRVTPCEELQPFVDWFWIVRWDLRDRPPFAQEVLPHPCVNFAIERDGKSAVHGPANARFVASLDGQGRVVGTKFRPEGFFAFTRVPMIELVDAVLPFERAMDPSLRQLLALESEDDPFEIIRAVEPALTALRPRADAATREVGRLVEKAMSDRSYTRTEQLAALAGVSARTLQRSFERVVGLPPKWILRRARVHEAAERVRSGEAVDWAALAQDLGYHDQSHLIRDFKDQVGFTPAAYVSRLEKPTKRSPRRALPSKKRTA